MLAARSILLNLLVLGLAAPALAGCLAKPGIDIEAPEQPIDLDAGRVIATLTDGVIRIDATGYAGELRLATAASADGTILTGEIQRDGVPHPVTQRIEITERSDRISENPVYSPTVTEAIIEQEESSATVRAKLTTLPRDEAASLRSFRGDFSITFYPSRIVLQYSFLLPTSLVAAPGIAQAGGAIVTPALGAESILTVGIEAPASTGAILPDGTVMAGDDGSALDEFEKAGRYERGGVYATDLESSSLGLFRAAKHASANSGPGGSFAASETALTSRATFLPGAQAASPIRGNLEEMAVADLLLFGAIGETPASLHGKFVELTTPKSLATDLDRDQPTKSNVVIAIVDTGINPYHLDFRNAQMAEHPSTYITGYPADAGALPLSYDTLDPASAIKKDEAVWKSVEPGKLYWFPGTKIIGGYQSGTKERPDNQFNPQGDVPKFILDNNGHGTGSASVAAGFIHGSNPDALLVVVEGFSGLKWAIQQPWIDFVSNSWGTIGNVPAGDSSHFPKARANGQVVLFAAGNGFSNTAIVGDRALTLTSQYTATDDVVVVGAVSPRSGQDYNWHAAPVDVASYGLHWPSASIACIDCEDYFGGTSCATPVTAGAASLTLLKAREALGDTDEGWRGEGIIAKGIAVGNGPLADGILLRDELVEAVQKTARPEPFTPIGFLDDPITVPDSPAYYVFMGYGIVNQASALRAADVLVGKAAMPDRSDVDRFQMAVDTVGNAWKTVPEIPL